MNRAATASGVLAVVALVACGQAQVARGRIDVLEAVVKKAEAEGAVRCAPKELALAKAHLVFAESGLELGSKSTVDAHLAIAEPNARAAEQLSRDARCLGPPRGRDGDRDGDGIADSRDRCPDARETYNGFEDADGCPDDPDTDGDGVPDSRDACLVEPEDKDAFQDADGCPDPDNDGDGIPDARDKCPNEPEDPDGFQDEDGCPDPDNDQDTVADVDDACPNTPGGPTGPRPGCPSLVVVTAKEIRITEQIQFDTNRASIKSASFPVLEAVADVLKANPKIVLEIQGHTDNVGQAAYNQKLSQQRAEAVRAYLVDKRAVDGARLVARGYGSSQPLVPNNSTGNRALNRRVQFLRTEAP